MPASNKPKAHFTSRVLSWLGCLLGTAFVLLFVTFAFGGREEPPPVSVPTIALGVMLLGYTLAWWRDWLGGLVSLAAFAAFYAWGFVSSGRLIGGPIFPICFLPGALCLLAAWLRGTSRASQLEASLQL